ncbi:Sjogren's syndrome/scleroderma autoantigen 1 family protein [Geoglobus acetivorans]|uniref:Uncharacterized protein n=1 Tax=Geoglobus acetivorans TaxID=565033 RepID=A0ABZ3H597_GEOAI|nr:hypothetical protein [Geoglobus acetivorans]
MKGAKMLSLHCPDCMLPLFQKDETVFCPSCKKEFEIIESENGKTLKIKTEEKRDTRRENVHRKTVRADHDGNINTITEKIDRLFSRLLDKAMQTDNFHELKELIHLMKELSEVYSILKR